MTTPSPAQRLDGGYPAAPFITEEMLMASIIAIAKALGWLTYHTWRSVHSQAGFPDLCMVRAEPNAVGGKAIRRLIFAELKSSRGRVSPAQREWLSALSQIQQVEVYLWTAEDLSDIEDILR